MLTKNRLGILAFALLASLAFGLIGQTSAPPLEASGQFPYLATNSTNAAFALAEGRTTTIAATDLVSMGAVTGSKFRGLEVVFYGVADNNDVANWKVFSVNRGTSGPSSGTTVDYCRRLFCSGTMTFGTQAGVLTSNGIKTTELIADELTLTTEAYGTAAYAAFGGIVPRIYSPGSNGEAVLWIPEGGNCDDWQLEFTIGNATSVNALVRRHR